MKRSICVGFFLSMFLAVSGAAQTAAPVPAATPGPVESMSAEEERVKAEIKLLEARQKYLNSLRAASGGSNITAETSGGRTVFTEAAKPNLESVSLSYEAVHEIAALVDRELKPAVSQYRGLVVYYEPDFLALTKYRLYREQVRQALANYEAIVAKIDDESKTAGVSGIDGKLRIRSVRSLGSEALLTGLNAPSMATTAIRSFAELASLFRTDKTIYESRDVVDERSMGAVIAGTFLKSNPNLVVYHPEQFVAEYEIGNGDDTSLYSQVSRVNAAEAYLGYFIAETAKLPEPEQDAVPLNRLIAAAKIVQSQIRGLGFAVDRDTDGDLAKQGPGANRGVSEFRQMMRAEKLDRILKPGPPSGTASAEKVGIIKIRLLASGGARRESKNLILGNKTDYSGSAVIEVALYDADGTMRASEIFSHHTGFRKLKKNGPPRP